MAAWDHVQVTDGPTQSDRLPKPLEPGYFSVDERDRNDLLAQLADLADHLPLPDLGDGRRQTWAPLFARDDAVVLARILAEPQALRAQRFAERLSRDPPGALGDVIGLADIIDRWLRQLEQLQSVPAAIVSQRLRERVEARLGPAVLDVVALAREAGLVDHQNADVVRLLPVWRRRPARQLALTPRRLIQRAFDELQDGIAYVQPIAARHLQEALQRADHDPALVMGLVFTQLLTEVQAELNGFTARHNTFYYREVLGARPRGRHPDRVMLALPEVKSVAPVRVRRGATLVAALPGGSTRVRFAADADTCASAARLTGLHTLHYERDHFVSPQRELDYVTRIRSTSRPIQPTRHVSDAAWSLFGAGDDKREDTTARFGLCVMSPCLFLREGRRRVTVGLGLRPRVTSRPDTERQLTGAALLAAFSARLTADPELTTAVGESGVAEIIERIDALGQPVISNDEARLVPRDPVTAALLCRLLRLAQSSRPRAFTTPLGRLFALLLLSPTRDERAVAPTLVDEIIGHADRALPGRHTNAADDDPVRALLRESRGYQYEKYLGDAFTLELTTAQGWYAIERLNVAPPEADERHAGLRFAFELGHDAPAIDINEVAANAVARPAVAPMLRLTLAPRATLCAHSLLEQFVLDEVTITVDVRGLRQISAHGDLGPVDPNAPFQPFGPTPRPGATFAVGAFETARKHVETLSLRLVWAGLPKDFGGFGAYYHAYGDAWSKTPFTVKPEWLVGGAWQTCRPNEQPLFSDADAGERLRDEVHVAIDVPAAAQPLPFDVPAAAFRYGAAARAGFARLVLDGPEEGFGHGRYPLLFARDMAKRLRWRKQPPPLNPPYTPTLTRLAIDYTARTRIRIAAVGIDMATARGEFVDHVDPFGATPVHPEPMRREPGVLPRRARDGALYIGISDFAPGKQVSLLFQMAERARRRLSFQPPAIRWDYLADRGWQTIAPGRIVADTTGGLMRSGVVTIDVPADAQVDGISMPAGAVWLRVGADADLVAFPALLDVVVNGFTVTEQDVGEHPLPATLTWQFEPATPMLEVIHQVGTPTGGLAAESERGFRARISERLRHRGRSVTAWDYERLVLERFHEVYKVKCFPALDEASPDAPAPGRVVIVVVPHANEMRPDDPYERRMFDVLSLRRIHEALAELAPSAVELSVQNPAYDLLETRCRVRLIDGSDRGLALRKLSKDVADYLSPWTDSGESYGFGWRFAADDVQAFLAEHPSVAAISEFAMLMLTVDDANHYRLIDTARPRAERNGRTHANVLSYSVPWSLPLPLPRQALTTEDGLSVRRRATPAGVGHLVVGSTLALSERAS